MLLTRAAHDLINKSSTRSNKQACDNGVSTIGNKQNKKHHLKLNMQNKLDFIRWLFNENDIKEQDVDGDGNVN